MLQTSTPRGGAGVGRPAGADYTDASGRLIHVGGGFGGYFPWARADIRVDDGTSKPEFKNVGIRYKGNLSFNSTSAAVPLFANFKIKLDLHGTPGTWDGEKTFNLHAGVVDTSKMRDAIAYTIFRAAGVPAPRTAYVELAVSVPGIYQDTPAGLFTLIEDVNKKFVERTLAPGTGLLMKPEGMRGGVQNLGATWSSYVPTYRPDRDATPHEQQRVMEFAQLVNQPDVTQFRARIGDYLDVDQFLRFVAVNAMIVNRDSFLGGSHNFYLYLDPKDGLDPIHPVGSGPVDGQPAVRTRRRHGHTVRRHAAVRRRPAADLLAPRRSRARRTVPRHRQRDRDIGVHGGGVIETRRRAREGRHWPRPVTARVHHDADSLRAAARCRPRRKVTARAAPERPRPQR